MSQDFTVLSDSLNPRVTINETLPACLEALRTDFAGATEPPNPVAYQTWLDTTTKLLKRRNAANSAWVVEGPALGNGSRVVMEATILATLATTTLRMGAWPAAWVAERVYIISDAATSSSVASTTEYTWMLRNQTQAENLFSATPSTATTVGGVGGGELAADAVTGGGTLTANQNTDIAAGDVIRFTVTKVGSPTAITQLKVMVVGYEVGA